MSSGKFSKASVSGNNSNHEHATTRRKLREVWNGNGATIFKPFKMNFGFRKITNSNNHKFVNDSSDVTRYRRELAISRG